MAIVLTMTRLINSAKMMKMTIVAVVEYHELASKNCIEWCKYSNISQMSFLNLFLTHCIN